MKKIIGSILILTGVTLEVLYYYQRYISEGTFPVWAMVQGIALTALLVGLFLLVSDNWLLWLLIVPLALYSIANTSAGQRQSLVMKAENEAVTINTERINEIEDSIERKQKRYDEVSALINNSISDFDEYWEWKNTTARYEDELKSLDSDIEALKKEKSELLNPDIQISTNMQVYVFWSDILGIDNPDLIQLIMQITFSFFIAIMAPIGAFMLTGSNESIKLGNVSQEKPEQPRADIDTWKVEESEIEKAKPAKTDFQDYKPPEKKPKMPPFNGLPFEQVLNIIIVLVRHEKYPGKLIDAKEAHEKFIRFHEKKHSIEIRTEEECRMVALWIHGNGLMGMTEKEIEERLKREYADVDNRN